MTATDVPLRDGQRIVKLTDSDVETRSVFGSLDEWIDHVRQPPKEGLWNSSRRREHSHRCYVCDSDVPYGSPINDWYGATDFPHALELADGKADNGMNEIRRYMDVMSHAIGERIKQPQYTLAIEGGMGDIDMGAYMSGAPEVFLYPDESYAVGPSTESACIWFNASASCGISTQVINARGAVTLALASLLEQANVPTRIVITCGFAGHGTLGERKPKHVAEIHAKEYGAPLDLPRMAFALCNPDMFRRFGFSHFEHLPKAWQRALGAMYGYPASPSGIPDDAIRVTHMRWDTDEDSPWHSEDRAMEWIEQVLKSKGVALVKEDA